ncbi:hypothetical protein CN949_16155 [Bacillus thuringiensis]|nr:hypothetical protein CN949_16155 [Bacillus thuringiensis]
MKAIFDESLMCAKCLFTHGKGTRVDVKHCSFKKNHLEFSCVGCGVPSVIAECDAWVTIKEG